VTPVRPVTREELLDYQTYGDCRDRIRAEILPIKARRRIRVGPHLMVLLENRDTVRYQIQEMMRAEQIVREDAVRLEFSPPRPQRSQRIASIHRVRGAVASKKNRYRTPIGS
jgi:hypothetical protein